MAGYDIAEARKAGVADADIAAALAPKLNYDLEGARKAGVPDSEIADALATKFNSTSGGAATGNPNITRQGDKAVKGGNRWSEPLFDIGGATALGAAAGRYSSEILKGLGQAAGALPQTRAAAPFLTNMGNVLQAGGRTAPTVAGAISGAAGESAGQLVEAVGGPQLAAEGARLVVGGTAPEIATGTLWLARKWVTAPALSVESKVKKELGKLILDKVDKGVNLDAQEREFLEKMTAELRGGPKSDASLEAVGTGMAESADNAVFQSGRAQARANADLMGVGPVAPVLPAEFGDTGNRLRGVITKRNEGLMKQRATEYTNNEKLRDQIVKARQDAGDLVENLPEFKALMQELDLATGATKKARMQTPLDTVGDAGIKSNLNVIRNAIREKSVMVDRAEFDQAKAAGLKVHEGTNPQTGEPAFYRDFPTSFEALDNVRRKLGEVFRGKPAEGYEAINAETRKDLYSKISTIQKKYAGGDNGPQAKLLEDYANSSEALAPFRSAKGRKATALDNYDDKQFATDASTLPATYFKSKASVQALKELTGDPAAVNRAAMEYVNKQLEGKSASEVDAYMRKNSEWLTEVPMVRSLVENHSYKLVSRERGVAQAKAFADEAAANRGAILGGRYPADRVRNLVQNGNMDLWERAGPAIASNQQAKAEVLAAVRQVLADKPIRPDQFARQIRPALKGAGLADDAALDLIQNKLQVIRDMKIPEEQKLGPYRRILLQAVSGYTASGMARGAVEAAKFVPE